MVSRIKNFGEIDTGGGSIFFGIHSNNLWFRNVIVIFGVVIVFVIEFRIRFFMILVSGFLNFLSIHIAYDGEGEYLSRIVAFL